MSVYDFNHNEQVNQTNRSAIANNNQQIDTRLTVSNGTHQANKYQNPGEYVNRGFSTQNQPHHHHHHHHNHLDMSNQLSRPTSKTAMLVRQRRAMLEQISCFICKGYLIDATTLDECMDSFCKSCIVTYLRSNSNCPKCGILIQKTDPLGSIRSDKVLQDIVYKLVPGLYDSEMKRRRDFYKNLYGSSSSSDEDDTDGSSSSSKYYNLTGERYGVVSHPKPFYKPTDNIDLSIEPQTRNDSSNIYYDNRRQSIVTCFTGNVEQSNHESHNFSTVDSQQFKTYLRCPAKLTALQLKKFIAAKFNIYKDDTIHLLYLNESLRDKYSLIDIAYIYDWRGIEHMKFYYIIERDLSRVDDIKVQQPNNDKIQNKSNNRQSVGTSTHTVKRVCIDPHPRFYEEPNMNNAPETNGLGNMNGGRSMRSRIVDSSKSITTTTNNNRISLPASQQQTSQHTLRSSISSARNDQMQLVNGNGKEGAKIPYGQIRYIPYPNNMVQNLVHKANIRQQTGAKEVIYCKNTTNESLGRGQPSSSGTTSSSTFNSMGSIPKMNINLNSLSQQQPNPERNLQTYSKLKQDDNHKNASGSSSSEQTNSRQVVPYMSRGGLYTSTGAASSNVSANNSSITGPSQSSLVTLASFTEARSNHVVAMSTSTAATISSSYSNILSADTSTRPEFMKSQMRVGNNQMLIRPNQHQTQISPQLAFSIVTERGITIVRRINGKEETQAASTSGMATKHINNNSSSALPIMPPSASSSSSSSSSNMPQQSSSSGCSQVETKAVASSSTGNSSQPSNQYVTSPRHHIKVKPVYKTFVDPTKLKTPNYKKFGYTARH